MKQALPRVDETSKFYSCLFVGGGEEGWVDCPIDAHGLDRVLTSNRSMQRTSSGYTYFLCKSEDLKTCSTSSKFFFVLSLSVTKGVTLAPLAPILFWQSYSFPASLVSNHRVKKKSPNRST